MVDGFFRGFDDAQAQIEREKRLAEQQAQLAEQNERAERSLALRERGAEQNFAQRNREEQRQIAEQQRQRGIEATRNVVGFFKRGLSSGASPEELVARAAPALRQIGVTDEQFEPLAAEIVRNPQIVDELSATLDQSGRQRRLVGRPIAIRQPDGRTALLQTFSDGSSEIIDGAIPLQQDLAEQRLQTQQPGFRGQVAEQQALGKARGTRQAEDLPQSQRATDVAARAKDEREARLKLVTSTVDKAIEQSGAFTAGLIGLTRIIPGTPAANLAATLDTIKANVGFQELQRLRDNSPTGGALGQVSERENILLQSVISSLEQSQSPSQLRSNLEVLKTQIAASQKRIADAFEEDFGVPYEGPDTPIPEIDEVSVNTNTEVSDPLLEDLLNRFAPVE